MSFSQNKRTRRTSPSRARRQKDTRARGSKSAIINIAPTARSLRSSSHSASCKRFLVRYIYVSIYNLHNKRRYTRDKHLRRGVSRARTRVTRVPRAEEVERGYRDSLTHGRRMTRLDFRYRSRKRQIYLRPSSCRRSFADSHCRVTD